jgi:hypothetical protein
MAILTGIERITAERERQIKKEGWTPLHDDQHRNDELAKAAACYALPRYSRQDGCGRRFFWPYTWNEKWWKPSPNDRIRELEKAGALIAAEIDRLLRIDANTDK